MLSKNFSTDWLEKMQKNNIYDIITNGKNIREEYIWIQ